jgi:hypothetical protein
MQQMLLGVHSGGSTLSSSSKGAEREAFVNGFLKEVLPPPFRFGIGVGTTRWKQEYCINEYESYNESN